jgi:class 3 adenylate cyclase
MQKRVQNLLESWRVLNHQLGFGVGLAMGPATVGCMGSEGRLDYSAIGNVVNLAARLCASAADSEILLDRVAASAVSMRVPLVELDSRTFKGFDQPVAVFSVGTNQKGLVS